MLARQPIIIALFFSTYACGISGNENHESSFLNAEHAVADTSIKDTMQQQQAEYILRNKLQGLWAEIHQVNLAVFHIKPDSVYYVDESRSYKYELRKDSLFIFYPDWIYSGKVSVLKDTMTITSEGTESRYTRFVQ